MKEGDYLVTPILIPTQMTLETINLPSPTRRSRITMMNTTIYIMMKTILKNKLMINGKLARTNIRILQVHKSEKTINKELKV